MEKIIKKYINWTVKWLTVVAVAVLTIQANTLPANAQFIIEPGETFEGPFAPQVVITPVCFSSDFGVYSFSVSDETSSYPLTDINFIPCRTPGDSYYPSSSRGNKIVVTNIGNVPLDVSPIVK
ncbi:hypothetical protein [Moorena sp. SIO3B2]|uniref:hypothetical protein n=1 Tax=Moorena sp. SIO3B2 TaxID=2607827 RepID=UPI0013CD792A|nr:hypothetical protein [Moorena sp. SIO3B2]NEP34974.1 hypothetical protein [Moorena sp. SIO3B2]